MAVAAVFVISEMVIGFKLGVPEKRKHDMVKKETMDRILKDKYCVAISLWLQDQQMMASSRMHKISYKNWIFAFKILKEDKKSCLGIW